MRVKKTAYFLPGWIEREECQIMGIMLTLFLCLVAEGLKGRNKNFPPGWMVGKDGEVKSLLGHQDLQLCHESGIKFSVTLWLL